MCVKAAIYLPDDMKKALYNASENEQSDLGRNVLGVLKR